MGDVISYLKKSFLIFSNLLGGGRNKDKNNFFKKFFLVDFVQRRARENPKNHFCFPFSDCPLAAGSRNKIMIKK
jgi:hypothetical protein